MSSPDKPSSPPLLRGLAERVVERFSQDAAALSALTAWVGEGSEPVERRVAERRAEVCLKCPHNKLSRRKLEVGVAKAILAQEEVRKGLDLSLPREGSLHSCNRCGCYLKLKVWVPVKHLSADDMPPTCWIPQERAGNLRYSAEDRILEHYRLARPVAAGRSKAVFNDRYTITNVAQGLGDSMILTDVWNASGRTVQPYSNSKNFAALTGFIPGWSNRSISPLMIDYPTANVTWDLGNGHNIQRIRRLFGVPVDVKPKGDLSGVVSHTRNPRKVVIHLDPGVHVNWQRRNIHPRARQVYPENIEAISTWARASGMDCFTVGGVMVPGIRHVSTPTVESLVHEIATASWFVGIMSGPMHVATALGLRCVVIINFPEANRIFLPTLVSTGQVEEEWFYPQNVHLHQDGDGPLVPRFSEDTLKAAFAGDVYPFWDDRWLPLIHETL